VILPSAPGVLRIMRSRLTISKRGVGLAGDWLDLPSTLLVDMKIYDVFEIIQKRLTKKLARARQAFLKENTLKKTQNCVNKGRNLSGAIHHCKINAMGNDELGASQCWDEKACLCPLFEYKYTPEQLDRQFQGMNLNELKLRWPSIGELIRVQDLLKQADEIKSHGQDPSRSVHTEKSDHLPASTTKEAGEPGSGVSGIDQPGPGDSPTTPDSIQDFGGRDDQSGASVGQAVRSFLPVADVAGPRDRRDSDRKAV
jgi:hypothetical protein